MQFNGSAVLVRRLYAIALTVSFLAPLQTLLAYGACTHAKRALTLCKAQAGISDKGNAKRRRYNTIVASKHVVEEEYGTWRSRLLSLRDALRLSIPSCANAVCTTTYLHYFCLPPGAGWLENPAHTDVGQDDPEAAQLRVPALKLGTRVQSAFV